jgi:hypothetical protein
VARPWTQVPDRREDRTRRAANKRATPGRLIRIPIVGDDFPDAPVEFPVSVLREFVANLLI